MMGHHARSEALFHYLRLEDQIPENRLLRLIERHIQLRNCAAATQRQRQRNPSALSRSRTAAAVTGSY
jgi:hypothetical protein